MHACRCGLGNGPHRAATNVSTRAQSVNSKVPGESVGPMVIHMMKRINLLSLGEPAARYRVHLVTVALRYRFLGACAAGCGGWWLSPCPTLRGAGGSAG